MPTADAGLGTDRLDHNVRLILNRTLGRTNYVANVAYLNVGREEGGRNSGIQGVLALARELPAGFGIKGELYGQTADDPGAEPRGIYAQGAATYQPNDRLHFDAGVRVGRGDDAPRIGAFAGLTTGVALLLR